MTYNTINVSDEVKTDVSQLKLNFKSKKLIKGRVSEDKVIRFLIDHYKKNKKK